MWLLILSHYFLLAASQVSVQDSAGTSSGQSGLDKVLEDKSYMSSVLASVCLLNPMVANFIRGKYNRDSITTNRYSYFLLPCHCFRSFPELTWMILQCKTCLLPCKVKLRYVCDNNILSFGIVNISWNTQILTLLITNTTYQSEQKKDEDKPETKDKWRWWLLLLILHGGW